MKMDLVALLGNFGTVSDHSIASLIKDSGSYVLTLPSLMKLKVMSLVFIF